MNNQKVIRGIEKASGWDAEYKSSSFLTQSFEPIQDVKDFFKYLKKNKSDVLEGIVVDLGCGNGRHAMYASRNFGMYGFGYDISPAAVKEAQREQKLHEDISCEFEVWNVAKKIPLNNAVASVVLDVTCSPSITSENIFNFFKEVARTMKHGGVLFSRQLILDGDDNAKELLKKSPFEDAYIHPTLQHLERVQTFDTVTSLLSEFFEVIYSEKSYGYQTVGGQKFKRRYGVWYCVKK